MIKYCEKHGTSKHYFIPSENRWRCGKCNYEGVKRRRKRVKVILVEMAGGCCTVCGYNKCVDALVFHHIDSTKKDFQLNSTNCARQSWDYVLKEFEKCTLVCANCHAEIHAAL